MIKEIKNKTEWSNLLSLCRKPTFLQTWEWGEFQKALNKNIKRIAIFENNTLQGLTLCIEENTFLSKYIYCPKGPLLTNDTEENYKKVLNELKEYWRNKGIYALKIDPAYIQNSNLAKIPQNLGFKHSINFIQSETNWMIDLVGNTEEDLLTWCKAHGMSKNNPTYIKKARRDGVEITFSNNQDDWKSFYSCLSKSGNKKDFEVKPLNYFMKMWEYLAQDSNILRLGIAKKDNNILAMILIAVYGDEVDCLYSAQTDIDTKLRAPLLLRWNCMLLGQKEKIKRFNNWGVLPEEKYKPGVPGYGYSQYKRSFGGYLEQLERTYEYVYNKKLLLIEKLYDWYIKKRYYRFR